jgi:hypothetical protein
MVQHGMVLYEATYEEWGVVHFREIGSRSADRSDQGRIGVIGLEGDGSRDCLSQAVG